MMNEASDQKKDTQPKQWRTIRTMGYSKITREQAAAAAAKNGPPPPRPRKK